MKLHFAAALVAAFLLPLALCAPAHAVGPAPTTAYSLRLDIGTKTATAVAGAATLHKNAGVVTTEALTTAVAGTYVLTLTDNTIAAADQVFASVSMGTSTTGLPDITSIKPGAGSVVITVQNAGTAVFNGTLKIAFARLTN